VVVVGWDCIECRICGGHLNIICYIRGELRRDPAMSKF
jgi:hypothetical protein